MNAHELSLASERSKNDTLLRINQKRAHRGDANAVRILAEGPNAPDPLEEIASLARKANAAEFDTRSQLGSPGRRDSGALLHSKATVFGGNQSILDERLTLQEDAKVSPDSEMSRLMLKMRRDKVRERVAAAQKGIGNSP